MGSSGSGRPHWGLQPIGVWLNRFNHRLEESMELRFFSDSLCCVEVKVQVSFPMDQEGRREERRRERKCEYVFLVLLVDFVEFLFFGFFFLVYEEHSHWSDLKFRFL